MSNQLVAPHVDHSRAWRENRFIYPVLSRRSKGLSIGVNLNPDKICNFDCVYCQIDRRSDAETKFVATAQLLRELRQMLALVANGEIWKNERFQSTPEHLRRLNDIAFSGDGEPTSHKNFSEVVQAVADVKREFGLDETKLVLITNASLFHRPAVREGLKILDANQGEIWAKLDAGTEDYYKLIERTPIPFSQVLNNIADAARKRPLVIQAMFLRFDGQGPPKEEIHAFCKRLNAVAQSGGQLLLIQVYTVARATAEANVTALSNQEVNEICEDIRARTGLTVEGYYGK